MSTINVLYKRDASYVTDAALLALLDWVGITTSAWLVHIQVFSSKKRVYLTIIFFVQRLSSLNETEGDLDYQPHLYAEEGDLDDHLELEDITIPEDGESFQTALKDLGSKFNQLALICKPAFTEI